MAIFYTGASGIGTGPHLDFRVWDVADSRYINPNEFTDLLMVNDKPLVDQFAMTSGYGERPIPTTGASSFHQGIDYATPVNTPVTVKNSRYLTTFRDSTGGRMSQYATMRDDKAYDIILLHGSNQNEILTAGPILDFDYSGLVIFFVALRTLLFKMV